MQYSGKQKAGFWCWSCHSSTQWISKNIFTSLASLWGSGSSSLSEEVTLNHSSKWRGWVFPFHPLLQYCSLFFRISAPSIPIYLAASLRHFMWRMSKLPDGVFILLLFSLNLPCYHQGNVLRMQILPQHPVAWEHPMTPELFVKSALFSLANFLSNSHLLFPKALTLPLIFRALLNYGQMSLLLVPGRIPLHFILIPASTPFLEELTEILFIQKGWIDIMQLPSLSPDSVLEPPIVLNHWTAQISNIWLFEVRDGHHYTVPLLEPFLVLHQQG